MPDGPSRYAYVANSPLMYTDPTGLLISNQPEQADGSDEPLVIPNSCNINNTPFSPDIISLPKPLNSPNMSVPPNLNANREREDICFERCQHLMGLDHGNVFRGCYRRCMGKNL